MKKNKKIISSQEIKVLSTELSDLFINYFNPIHSPACVMESPDTGLLTRHSEVGEFLNFFEILPHALCT